MIKETFSVYRPPISSAIIPVGSQDLDSVWEEITDRTLKEQTDRLRELLSQNNREEYKKQKGLILPSATFGGIFDYRSRDQKKLSEQGKRGLLSASGLVVIDIDHISETGHTLDELREALSADSEIGVRLIFVSPSGDGLKVICKTSKEISDPQSYRTVFDSLRHYINSRYGEIVDKSGSDITRLCLLCYDPDARILDSEGTFDPDRHPVPKREIPRSEYTYAESSASGDDGIEEIVRRVEASGLDIAPDYADYLILTYSFVSLGERGRGYLHRVCSLSPKYNPEDTDRQFDTCSASGEKQSIGTFVNMCKKMGIDVSSPVEKIQTENAYKKYTPKTSTPKETEPQQQEQPEEEKYKEYLCIPPLKEVAKKKMEGIKTGYKFKNLKGKEEELTLRSGAMTLICGKSSHCKSKLLQNLAVQISQDMYDKQEDGSVLFFSYEEELSDELLQFANIYSNVSGLSKYGTPNTEIIQDFLTTGNSSRCTREKKDTIQRKLHSFQTLYESGTLRVYYTDKDSQSLCDLIRYLTSKIKVKAVFVDYVQLLYRDYSMKGGRRPERREEIKEICNDLRKTAIDLGLPMILAAQLNRETPNPTDMSEDNVADSADLTRYANTIVCLWNSAFDNVKDGKEKYLKSEDGIRLQARGFKLGEGGQIFAKITKNRGGTPYIDTIFDFVTDTGCIPRGKADQVTYGGSLLDDDDLPEDL